MNKELTLKTDVRIGQIAPQLIYGFPDLAAGEPPVITDHPDFPNGRSEMDEAWIEEIKNADSIHTPIEIHILRSGNNSVYVPVDGKTRLTAVARRLAEDPGFQSFNAIPFVVVRGTDMEARTRALIVNLADNRRAWSELDVARYLLKFDDAGLSNAEQAALVGKSVKWVVATKRVAASDTLTQAVEEGTVDLVTARQISKEVETEEERDGKIQQVRTILDTNNDATQADIRRVATRRPGNRTTVAYPVAWGMLEDIYPAAKEAIKKICSPAFDDEQDVDWADGNARLAYIDELMLIQRYRLYVTFLKIPGTTLREQMTFIESQLSEGIKFIDWLPLDTTE